MGLLSSVSFLLYVFAWATPCFSGATAEVCKSCRMAGYKAVGSRSTRPTEGSCSKFIRSEKGKWCGDNKKNVLKAFIPPSSSISDAIKSRNDCEEFCCKDKTCWGCSLHCGSPCQFNAIPNCGAVQTWSGGVIEGDITQKPGKARSVSNDPIGRALGSLTTSDYDIKFTEENKRILESYHLLNKRMVRDTSVNPTSETLEWTQVSRCFWSCEEEYLLVDYYQDGDKSNPVMKVFVAKSELSPPSEFRTSGYEGYLHFGFLYFGDQNQAIFFVLHPNGWGPYQHRFKTNSFTAFFNKGVGSVLTNAAGAAAGAAIGSIVPGVGTIIGGLVGASVGALSDDYFGDYLRYIG